MHFQRKEDFVNNEGNGWNTSTCKIFQQPDKVHLLRALALPDFTVPLSFFPLAFPFYQFEILNSHKGYLSKYICLVQDPSPSCTSLWWGISGSCSSPEHITVAALVPDTSAWEKLKIFPICQRLHLCTGTDRSNLDIFPLFVFFPF